MNLEGKVTHFILFFIVKSIGVQLTRRKNFPGYFLVKYIAHNILKAKETTKQSAGTLFIMKSQPHCRCIRSGLVWSAFFYTSFLLTAPGM